MKRLTYNRLAGAGLRANRRSYLSLCAGIFASIFLVCSVVLSAFAGLAGYLENIHRALGRQEALVYDVSEERAQKILAMSEKAGFGTIRGLAGAYAICSYDETAADLAYRQMFEGRMPEKAGEIAMELEPLGKLAPNAEPGDTISLSLLPLEGKRETRDFVLTGIVKPQKQLNDKRTLEYMLPGVNICTPQVFVAPEEPPFATGNTIRNLYLTTDGDHTLEDIAAAVGKTGILGFTDYGRGYLPGQAEAEGDPILAYVDSVPVMAMIGILGGSLLAFALFGIISALDGQLERKKEEIGMLRAVGATRRQIRRIFGRESWLLALILSPAAVGGSVLFEWLLCRLFPNTFVFSLPLLAVGIMAAASVLFVLMASFIPLWRCSRQRPMGLIRDTKSLRRARQLRSRTSFRPTVLMQRRKLRLHPMRYVTGAVLTTLLCIAMLLTTITGRDALRRMQSEWDDYDFWIYKGSSSGFSDLRTALSEFSLSDADLGQLRDLPHVERVQTEWASSALWCMDELPDYLKQCRDFHVMLTNSEPDSPYVTAFRQLWNTEDAICHLEIFVTDHPESMVNNLTDGSIDRAALDAGTEVLFYAPDFYLTSYGDGYSYYLNAPLEGGYDNLIHNDSISVGQTVRLHQLAADVADPANDWDGLLGTDLITLYQKADHRQAETRIGGIVKALSGNGQIGSYFGGEPMFVTTPQGMAALGLRFSEVQNVRIYLDSDVDEDTEAYLESRITRIANRGEALQVFNEIAANRDNRKSASMAMVVFPCILLVFLWISVSIISSSVARQMQAEKRTIGTLRALGMEERRLISSYAGQAAVTILLGLVLASPGFIVVGLYADPMTGFWGAVLPGLIGVLLIAAVALLLCRWRVGRIGKKLLKESVIDNIREV